MKLDIIMAVFFLFVALTTKRRKPYILCICFRALKAGVKSPLLVVPSYERFKQVELVTILGALEALYVVSFTSFFSLAYL